MKNKRQTMPTKISFNTLINNPIALILLILYSIFYVSYAYATDVKNDTTKDITSDNTSNITTLATDCNAAISKNDYAKSLLIADEIIKLDVTNSNAYLCKGRALAAQNDYKSSLDAFKLATQHAKTGMETIVAATLTGNCHKQLKKYPEAITSYESGLKASQLEKNEKFARINLILIGETQVLNQDLKAAITTFTAADKLSNNDNERADGYEHLAATYSAMNSHDKAIEFQLKAVQMQIRAGTLDQQAEAGLQQGRIYTAAKEFANAERAYNKLIKFSQDNGSAYFEAKATVGLALTKIASGDKTTATTLINYAKKIAKDTNDKALADEIELAIK